MYNRRDHEVTDPSDFQNPRLSKTKGGIPAMGCNNNVIQGGGHSVLAMGPNGVSISASHGDALEVACTTYRKGPCDRKPRFSDRADATGQDLRTLVVCLVPATHFRRAAQTWGGLFVWLQMISLRWLWWRPVILHPYLRLPMSTGNEVWPDFFFTLEGECELCGN